MGEGAPPPPQGSRTPRAGTFHRPPSFFYFPRSLQRDPYFQTAICADGTRFVRVSVFPEGPVFVSWVPCAVLAQR